MKTKRELQEDNERLRGRLEEAYDLIGDTLGVDDDSTDEDGEDESDVDEE